MVLTRRHGLLVEATDPTWVMGIQHCWISDKRPGSPTENAVLAHGKGGTVAEAVEQATAELQKFIESKAAGGSA